MQAPHVPPTDSGEVVPLETTLTKEQRHQEAIAKKNEAPQFIRNCKVFFTDAEIGSENIAKICSWYEKGRQIKDIVLGINGLANSIAGRYRSLPTISSIDCYAILYRCLVEKRIKQRSKHLEMEFKLEDWYAFYNAWRRGYTDRELMKLKVIRTPTIARSRQIAVIKARFYSVNRKIKEVSHERLMEIVRSADIQAIAGRLAYVIYLDEIPTGMIEEFQLPTPEEITGEDASGNEGYEDGPDNPHPYRNLPQDIAELSPTGIELTQVGRTNAGLKGVGKVEEGDGKGFESYCPTQELVDISDIKPPVDPHNVDSKAIEDEILEGLPFPVETNTRNANTPKKVLEELSRAREEEGISDTKKEQMMDDIFNS